MITAVAFWLICTIHLTRWVQRRWHPDDGPGGWVLTFLLAAPVTLLTLGLVAFVVAPLLAVA